LPHLCTLKAKDPEFESPNGSLHAVVLALAPEVLHHVGIVNRDSLDSNKGIFDLSLG
jgi:hypothetical protein